MNKYLVQAFTVKRKFIEEIIEAKTQQKAIYIFVAELYPKTNFEGIPKCRKIKAKNINQSRIKFKQ